jgi:hypothetical protein
LEYRSDVLHDSFSDYAFPLPSLPGMPSVTALQQVELTWPSGSYKESLTLDVFLTLCLPYYPISFLMLLRGWLAIAILLSPELFSKEELSIAYCSHRDFSIVFSGNIWWNWATELLSEIAKVLSNHTNDLLDAIIEHKLIELGKKCQNNDFYL